MTTPKRRQTHQVKIDHLIVGSDAPVVVQSMTNTDTADAEATARQVKELSDAGSEMVRITVNTPEAASKVAEIRSRLDDMGYTTPLIGDFHFNGERLLAEFLSAERPCLNTASTRAMSAKAQKAMKNLPL